MAKALQPPFYNRILSSEDTQRELGVLWLENRKLKHDLEKAIEDIRMIKAWRTTDSTRITDLSKSVHQLKTKGDEE